MSGITEGTKWSDELAELEDGLRRLCVKEHHIRVLVLYGGITSVAELAAQSEDDLLGIRHMSWVGTQSLLAAVKLLVGAGGSITEEVSCG